MVWVIYVFFKMGRAPPPPHMSIFFFADPLALAITITTKYKTSLFQQKILNFFFKNSDAIGSESKIVESPKYMKIIGVASQ
jgi:hypothetical protein